MNRSNRCESALTSLQYRWSGLTSAATKFVRSCDLQELTRIETKNNVLSRLWLAIKILCSK